MSKYKKSLNEKRPTKKQFNQREQYFKEREELRKHAAVFWQKVYKSILEDSFDAPIRLRLNHDFDHKSDWRFCLYKGNIYQFDKPDLSEEVMVAQINKWEGWDKPEEPGV